MTSYKERLNEAKDKRRGVADSKVVAKAKKKKAVKGPWKVMWHFRLFEESLPVVLYHCATEELALKLVAKCGNDRPTSKHWIEYHGEQP